jgi:CubicO group peptidase (beta-lactamase class C family)
VKRAGQTPTVGVQFRMLPTLVSILATIAPAVFLWTGAPPAQQPAPIPSQTTTASPSDTPAVQRLKAWLDAFNSGDRARLLRFMEEQAPGRVSWVDADLAFRNLTGGFELKKIVEATPTRVVALLDERDSDRFTQLTFEVDAAPPHPMTRVEPRLVPRPAEFAIPRLSEAQAVSALRDKAAQQAAADKFAGAVAIAKQGKIIFSSAYGLADRDKPTANTPETRFRIGSMNKMITAVAVLQLAQAGRVKLTAPLGTYLTDYPNKDVASKVTLHHLLTHTGGTGDIFGPDFEAKRLQIRTLNDYVALYGARGLEFEPGSRWAYSNYGFLLLGVIVERVTGGSYYDYVKKQVYEPAGMTGTGSQPEAEVVANRAVGYTKLNAGPGSASNTAAWRPNTDTLPYRGTSAGGGYSTASDLVRFADALITHKLLNAEYATLLMTGKVDTPMRGSKYAYGFQDSTAGGVRTVGHGGGAPGQNGDLIIHPDSGYIIAVLSNLDPPAASGLSQFASNRLPAR